MSALDRWLATNPEFVKTGPIRPHTCTNCWYGDCHLCSSPVWCTCQHPDDEEEPS